MNTPPRPVNPTPDRVADPPAFYPVHEIDLASGTVRPGVRLRVWDRAPVPGESDRDSYVVGEFLGFTPAGDLRLRVESDTNEDFGRIGSVLVVVRPGVFGIYEFPGRVEVPR